MSAGPGGPAAGSSRGPNAGGRDPRTIVTPEAFTISSELLGLPLASPSRRLAAILVDLVVIGVLSLLTRSFFFVVFLAVAALLLRASYGGLRDSDFVGRAFRISVGCLGAVLLLVALVSISLFLASPGDEDAGRAPGEDAGRAAGEEVSRAPGEDDGVVVREPGLRELVRGGREAIRFRRAATAEQAVRSGAALAREMRLLGVDAEGAAEILRESVPADAPWTPEADAVVERALEEGGFVAEPSELTADTLRTLSELLDRERERTAALEEELSEVAQARDRARSEARRAQEGGAFRWLRDLVDQLGFGFGWAALYFTLVMPWTGGRTAGKRLLGIRVVQLDGSPIDWWEAFERAGGYAAGFATGLLGFAQVYWDPNRQAIHDKVAGTVVVRDGLPPVPGPWRRSAGAHAPARRTGDPPSSPPPPDPIGPSSGERTP